MDVVGRKGLMFVDEARSDFLTHIMIAIASTTSARPGQRKMAWPRIGIGELAKPSASDKSHLPRCAPPAGTVPPKVWPESENSSLDAARFSGRLEHRQCRSADAGQEPAASIESRDRSAEDITRERKRCDVTRGRTSVSV